MAAALLLAIAGLAMLSGGLTASAKREVIQQPNLPGTQQQGVAAPMKHIDPVSVSVINFQKLAEAEEKRKASGFKEIPELTAIHPPLSIPESEEFSGKQVAPQAPQSEGGGPSIPSPGPSQSFLGIDDTGNNIPPDTTGAVGPDRIFVNVNGRYRVLDKSTGAVISTVSVGSFWTSTGASGVFDPRVQYDPYNNRWIVAIASNASSGVASILVGISATSDPAGTFTLFRFQVGCAAGAQGCDTTGEWADFPMLGFNKNWVAVGWNQFNNHLDSNNSSAPQFIAGKVLILDYPSLRAGTSNSNTSTVSTVGNFCMHPATTYSPSEDTLYIPVHRSSGGALYRLHKITGTPSAPVLNLDPFDHTRPGGGWNQPGGDILPQTCVGTPGTTCPTTLRQIDSADAQIRSNVAYRNGNICYAQTIGFIVSPATSITRTAAQWTCVNTNGTFVDGGRVDDPTANATAGEWYAYASIGVNTNNDILLGFTNFSATHFARAGYTFRAGTDAAGTMHDPLIFKEGEDYYAKTFGGTRNRWGDYSNTVVDPANDKDLWTIQEYAATRIVQDSNTVTSNSRWGIWWAKIPDQLSPQPSPTPPPSPTPTPTPPPPPANDNFVNAQVISNCAGSVTGTNVGGSKESSEPSHDPLGNPGASSVWYQWQAPASGSVTITTIGSDFDTLLGVYTGNAVNSLTACPTCKNDDISANPYIIQSSVTFTATSGVVYKIAVDGWGGETGNIVLNWTQASCIFTEPGTNRAVALDSVTFVRDAFPIITSHNFSSDQHTRVILFTGNLNLTQPDASQLTVQASGTQLTVENVGSFAPVPGTSYVIVRLPNGLASGDRSLTITLRGVTSNAVLLGVSP